MFRGDWQGIYGRQEHCPSFINLKFVQTCLLFLNIMCGKSNETLIYSSSLNTDRVIEGIWVYTGTEYVKHSILAWGEHRESHQMAEG